MTAGVPGTGIGGLFYLAAAVVLPVRGLAMKLRGAWVSWPTIFRQVRLAIGVLLGIVAMGWFLGFIVGPVPEAQQIATRMGAAPGSHYQNVVRWAALLVGYATLALVMIAVQFARFVLRPRTK